MNQPRFDLRAVHEAIEARRRVQRVVMWAAFAAVVFAALFSFVAFGQEVAHPLDPATMEPAHPVVNEVLSDVQPLLDVATGKVVGAFAVVVAILLGLSRLLQRFGKKLPGKAGELATHPVVAWVLPILLSVLGALFTALAAGAPVTVGLVVGAVLAGMAAAGTGNKQQVLDHAVAKGEVARASVTDKAAALEALAKADS